MTGSIETVQYLIGQMLANPRVKPTVVDAVDIVAWVVDIVPLLGHTLGEHIMIRSDFPPDLSRVSVDATQLEAAVLNIAVSARDAIDLRYTCPINKPTRPMRRSFSSFFRFMACLLMLTIMSSSVAMAAYVCPRDTPVPVAAAVKTMKDCAGMDTGKPALCATQQSGAQLALEHLANAPVLAPIVISTIAPASLPRAVSLPPDLAFTAPKGLGADPPYLRTQRLRI